MWKRAGLKLISWYKGEAQRFFLNSFHKFIFVRHPLHRLVSAYRDKFFFPTGENKFIYNLYGKAIKEWYPENPNRSITIRQPSEDFVTFKQFIQYVADTALSGMWLNDHFSPYYDLCRPCDIEYNFIGKMETMQIDSQFIIKKFFKNSTIDTLPGMSASSKSTHESEVRDIFQTLPKDLVTKLYFAFQPDFDMYGYSLEDLL